MKAIKVELELQPFRIPNYVSTKSKPGLRQEGLKEVPKYAIEDLPVETLEALCEQFRLDILAKKAGKAQE